jgi:hypothetical protein
MISDGCLAECLARLGRVSFFPKDHAGIAEIGKLLNELCLDDNEARTVVATIWRLGWDGPKSIFEAHASATASSMYAPYKEPEALEESNPDVTKEWLDQMDAEFKALAAARRAKGNL